MVDDFSEIIGFFALSPGGVVRGIRGTAEGPCALDGTFRSWWMILLRSLECDCFSYPLRYPSRTTASRTLRISVHECLSAVGFWSLLANISVHQRFKETALRAHSPSIPPPFLPRQSPGAKGGQAVEGVRREALGISGTAKEPYALEGTFRGWWMILLR
jgi:hypothetical protein